MTIFIVETDDPLKLKCLYPYAENLNAALEEKMSASLLERKSDTEKKPCPYCNLIHETMTCPKELNDLFYEQSDESIAKSIDVRMLIERANTIKEVFQELKGAS